MAQEDADPADPADRAPPAPPGRRRVAWPGIRRSLLVVGLLLLAGLLLAWFERTRIIDNVLARELARRGIEARYRVEQVSTRRQVLADVAIGDPAAPDLTIERLVVFIRPRFGFPEITAIEVVRPRLRGSYRGGRLSFGALDPLIFTDSDEPFELPDLDLAITAGRGLVETDFGPVGLRLAGSGALRSGFAGELAATAPALAAGGCAAAGATLYGRLAIADERPRFAGPLRFRRLDCAAAGVALAGGSIALDLAADRELTGVAGKARLALGPLAAAGARLAALSGATDFTWRTRALTARYALEGRDLASAQGAAARLAAAGLLRARDDFARIELEGDLTGGGLALGPAVEEVLASAQAAGEGALTAPLVAQVSRQLARELRTSTLAAGFTARLAGERRALLVPSAVLTGSSGATLLALTGGEAAQAGEGAAPLLAGDFTTGGEGLPQLAGRLTRSAAGALSLRLAMPEYAAGQGAAAARLALPALTLTQGPGGALAIAGRVLASGPLPGGAVRDLDLPLAGTWSQAGGLELWPGCTQLRFASLAVADLTLGQDALTVCPPPGAALVRYDGAGLRLAAGVAALDLSGRIGATPITIASGPVGLAWPGALTARELAIALGPTETASRFAIADLTVDLSGDLSGGPAGDIAGRIDGADISLAAVPLDLRGAAGELRYAAGRLTLSDGAFTLQDRSEAPRFRPLIAEAATLALAGNVIDAQATLREPRTRAEVTRLDLRHDLTTGTGHADLAVPGITFGEALQPTDLTRLAFGVVALVEGTVTGTGRIDWNSQAITSTGRFSSDKLDFAAAFGPVAGAAGTVEFTDLIGLTTAPGQRLAIGTVNPGIEVYDGEVAFQLREGAFIDLQSATWPFLGGTLTMRPLTLAIGVAEQRGYVLDLKGLEAASFIERMQLENLAATGTLDGTIPIIFDAAGNGRIEGGTLASRAPGGNVAYVGQLTYEDMSTMVNFAFDALRSLDYRQMRVAMDGPLTGELVTQVALEGVSQGAEIEQNFITRRLAELPIRLVMNLRAPFYRLLGSVRSLYDPSAVRDPRDLGLIGADGAVIQRQTDQDAVEALEAATQEAAERAAAAAATAPDPAGTDIQPPESEPVP